MDGFRFNRKAVVWLSAIIVAVNGFFPAVWIFLTALKTETELIKSPITYLPLAPTLANFETAFTAQPIIIRQALALYPLRRTGAAVAAECLHPAVDYRLDGFAVQRFAAVKAGRCSGHGCVIAPAGQASG